MSSFFRNVDTRYEDPMEITVGNGKGLIRSLKARAVVVDMEEGVVNATLRGPLGELFDSRQVGAPLQLGPEGRPAAEWRKLVCTVSHRCIRLGEQLGPWPRMLRSTLSR
jgi:hypothetical protein